MSTLDRRRAPNLTRAEILNRALDLAAERGAAGLTLDAVAEHTSVPEDVLLHHFPTRTALLEEMIDDFGRVFTQSILAEAERDPGPYGRNARAYLRVIVHERVTERDMGIGRLIWTACAMEPALVARWTRWMLQVTMDDPSDAAGADEALMLRLLADGMWMSDLFGLHPISKEQRKVMLSLLTPGCPALLEPVDLRVPA